MLVNFADFSSIQKHPDTWIPMDKVSIMQVSMISTIHGIQLSKYPTIQISMICKYPWYPSIWISEKSDFTELFHSGLTQMKLHNFFCPFIQ